MKPHHLAAPLIMFVSSALAFPLPNPPRPSAFPGPSRPADLPVVYLTDFELNAVPPTPARLRPPNSAAQQTDDEPSTQAIRLVKFLSLTLSNSLKRAGYTVQPFPGSGRPDKGLLIRGVFTEPDEYNRVRRTILGSGSKSAKFVVYIGVNNLASPEQPLYQLVAPNTPGAPVDTRFGPLITITSYGPVTSFELERRPSDDAVKRMAEDIVAKLSALVTANPQLAE
jgi:hypothetical protein